MSDDDRDVLIQQGALVEIDANFIAGIIFHTCHCSQARATKAANLIIDYLAAEVLGSGMAEDVTNPTGKVQ